jgi:hypothetical protein
MRSRTRPGWATTSKPATRAVPAEGRSSVVRTLISVVLPAPLGPSSPNSSPCATATSTPFSAVTVAPFGVPFALGAR